MGGCHLDAIRLPSTRQRFLIKHPTLPARKGEVGDVPGESSFPESEPLHHGHGVHLTGRFSHRSVPKDVAFRRHRILGRHCGGLSGHTAGPEFRGPSEASGSGGPVHGSCLPGGTSRHGTAHGSPQPLHGACESRGGRLRLRHRCPGQDAVRFPARPSAQGCGRPPGPLSPPLPHRVGMASATLPGIGLNGVRERYSCPAGGGGPSGLQRPPGRPPRAAATRLQREHHRPQPEGGGSDPRHPGGALRHLSRIRRPAGGRGGGAGGPAASPLPASVCSTGWTMPSMPSSMPSAPRVTGC